ncbi:MAG: histidyl-tRNA synthetase [Candidatus Saccharimonadales bacterium]|jgi:histidyl-tRNA synthetase
MKISTQPYKGSRDFYPEDKRIQNWIFDNWRIVVERYGYEHYDAPILEPTDLFLMKGSEEIVREQTYTFLDRGDRSVTIRTEMTPTVSRMVAGRRQEIAYPARWYSIPNLWRYERMQKGRLREFWQLNVDMFGVASGAAELEMIQIVDGILQQVKAKRSSYVIKVNSRVLVSTLFVTILGLSEEKSTELIRVTDKKNKMSATEFEVAVHLITQDEAKTRKVVEILNIKTVQDLPADLQGLDSVIELRKLVGTCKSQGVRNIEFDITLMRGFDYYTDIVFEAFDTNPDNNRSMLGGGRYDGLVGQFGVEPVPTVGFAMGDVVFQEFLESNGLIPDLKPTTEIYVIIRDLESSDGAQLAANELREMGVNVAVDYSGKKVDKQFKSANKNNVAYVLFIGREELEAEQYVLKDLKSGKEVKHSLQRIVSIVKDSRKK